MLLLLSHCGRLCIHAGVLKYFMVFYKLVNSQQSKGRKIFDAELMGLNLLCNKSDQYTYITVTHFWYRGADFLVLNLKAYLGKVYIKYLKALL